MKIAYLCLDLGIPVLGRQGGSAHVRGLVAALERAGHAVVLVAPILTDTPWEKSATVDASLMHVPPAAAGDNVVAEFLAFNQTLGAQRPLAGELRRILYNRDVTTQLRRRFDSCPPDFIYERASLYMTAGVTLGRTLNVPVVVELNAPLALEQAAYRTTGLGALAAQAERWMLTRADAVVTVSASLRDYVVSLGVEPARVHEVRNGVDPALFRPGPRDPAVRARWKLGDGPVLGFVGGLRAGHGVEAFPAVLAGVMERHAPVRFLVVGDGPLRGELERDLQKRGIEQNAVLTGSLPHEEIGEVIREFDVALASYSQREHSCYSSPLTLFEYMACGVPVVAAAAGQIAEVVRDGETGLLYPPGDSDALVAACSRLLADARLRRRMGEAAAHAIRAGYTCDRNAERVVDLARSLFGRRHA